MPIRRFVAEYEAKKCVDMLYSIFMRFKEQNKIDEIDKQEFYTLTLKGEQLLGIIRKCQYVYRNTRRFQFRRYGY